MWFSLEIEHMGLNKSPESYILGELLSVNDAAKQKSVTPQAIYAAIKKQQLPYISFKGRIYLQKEAFDRLYIGKYSRSKLVINGERVFDGSRFSVKDAAKKLQMSVQQVYYAIKKSIISAEKKGNTWVVYYDGIKPEASDKKDS